MNNGYKRLVGGTEDSADTKETEFCNEPPPCATNLSMHCRDEIKEKRDRKKCCKVVCNKRGVKICFMTIPLEAAGLIFKTQTIRGTRTTRIIKQEISHISVKPVHLLRLGNLI